MKVRWSGKNYRVQVKRTNLFARQKEIFQIVGANKTILIESNRPLLEHKNLVNWKPNYKITSAAIQSPGFEKALLEKLHFSIECYEGKLRKS